MVRVEMENCITLLTEKLQKISALSGKTDKYEYLIGKETLLSNQKQIIEQAKFAYFPLGKLFEKQTKTIKKRKANKSD